MVDGSYISPADAQFDLVVLRRGTTRHVILSGPTAKARTYRYKEGFENVGIRFCRGVHMSGIATSELVDVDLELPSAGGGAFWLQGYRIPIPTFDNAELVVERLATTKILQRDIVVEQTLKGKPLKASNRSVQRHFLASTGMTHVRVGQILRAEQAAELLSRNIPITRAASEAGYADVSHMARWLRMLLASTPGNLRAAQVPVWRQGLSNSAHPFTAESWPTRPTPIAPPVHAWRGGE